MGEDCPHCVFEKTEANCPGCFEGSHYRPKPITNADRLRAMSVEEMAEFLAKSQKFGDIELHYDGFYQLWLDWLRQEAVSDG